MTKTRSAQLSTPFIIILALVASTTVLSRRIQIRSHDSEKLRTNSTEGFLPLLILIPVIVGSVGVGGAGAALAAKSVSEYFNTTDAPKNFSYIRMPKAEACMPDYTSPTFFSKTTKRTYDPRKCSMCRSITGSLSEIDMTTSWYSWWSTENITTLSHQACSNISKDVLGLHSDCLKLATSLITEVDGLHRKLRDLEGATTHGSYFAAHASCEDLQCCPQDPFVAEVVAGVASDGLRRPEDVQAVESLGVVGAILGSSDVRANLGEHLAYMSIRRHTLDNESFIPPEFIVSDKQCTWDYLHAKCKYPDTCQYSYKFGDLTLDESCRLKPSAKAPPESDSGCTWDYSVNKCFKSDFCSRQCQAGDSRLSDCCRLREPKRDDFEDEEVMDGSKPQEGNCYGEEDLDIMAAPDTPAEMERIGRESFSLWTMRIDAAHSFQEHVMMGLSQRCASCFVDVSVCGIENCFSQLAKDKESEASKACIAAHCTPDLLTCAGVEATQLPER